MAESHIKACISFVDEFWIITLTSMKEQLFVQNTISKSIYFSAFIDVFSPQYAILYSINTYDVNICQEEGEPGDEATVEPL